MKKREYKISSNGTDFYTDNLSHALQAFAWVIIIFVLGIFATRTFWIVAAIIAGAYIIRGGC
jgi:hypothetical protein